jgi:succinate dehydrogenase / fumarate reductase membrane anchor subunit
MADPKTSMRDEMSRVKGLGTAKEGPHHWWAQRLTALALIPLGIWFVASLVALAGADHMLISYWLGSPVTLGVMSLLVIAVFYHAALGLQVVIEDYIHGHAAKLTLIILVQFGAFALGAAAIVSMLWIALKN